MKKWSFEFDLTPQSLRRTNPESLDEGALGELWFGAGVLEGSGEVRGWRSRKTIAERQKASARSGCTSRETYGNGQKRRCTIMMATQMSTALIDHRDSNGTTNTQKAPPSKPSEGFLAFDFTCTHYLGISGQEFLVRHAAGEFADSRDQGVLRALSMLEFAR